VICGRERILATLGRYLPEGPRTGIAGPSREITEASRNARGSMSDDAIARRPLIGLRSLGFNATCFRFGIVDFEDLPLLQDVLLTASF
jgi:hypothetical protein